MTQQPTETAQLITQVIDYQKAGDTARAERLLQQILAQQPDNSDALHLYGLLEHERGNNDLAAHIVEQAIARNPAAYLYHSNLGTIYRALERPVDAERELRIALSLRPAYADAHNNLGVLLADHDRRQEAICHYLLAISLKPGYAEAHCNLGNNLREQGRLDAAIGHYHRSLELRPDYAEAWYNLALAVDDTGDVEEAIRCYDKAITLKPDYVDAQANRALALLVSGDLQQGFIDYEWRWKSSQTKEKNINKPLWAGERFSGKTLFIHAEQGLGDAIQFIRYIPLIAELGGRIVVECDKVLLRLFAGVPGISKLVPRFSAPPAFDLHIPSLSIPRVMGTTLETIPAQVPYLKPPANPAPILTLPPAKHLKVGFVWAGNRDFPNDKNRSVEPASFLELLAVPNVRLYSLQKGPDANDIVGLCAANRVRDLSGRLHDFADTAAIIAQLDLVISVDTAVAHLAGALGKPVWTLLPFNPDWRWLLEREDSPWYPTMRLFRQQRIGDWHEVFGRLVQALGEFKAAADC